MTKKELEKLKDFKVYTFEWDVYVKSEDYKEKAIENISLKEENDRLKNNAMEDMRVQTKLEEKVRFLEECLDRKEKLNEEYRKEIEELKYTYVYDAKQVRDIC